ncbi:MULTISPECIES: DUF397 domain-containing protein [unclassified Streptomyces]|uniref:DUF397 domain-containing protein n=1 Tax=unclassified Streptomyces TaxID=2593676 RepID=UPI0006961837|nr:MULTISPECIES: DUF397 domain-containing protein [unclassified Streptomyces]ODA73700.1 hypothetical protein APS67_001966 [Streptomyces sp. AVP053U2]
MRSTRPDLTAAVWRKSTYSDGGGGDCLETADNIPGTVPVRDSKNPTGTILLIGTCAWAAFVDGIRTSGR